MFSTKIPWVRACAAIIPSLQGRGWGWVRLKRLDAAEDASSWALSPFVSNPPLAPPLQGGKKSVQPIPPVADLDPELRRAAAADLEDRRHRFTRGHRRFVERLGGGDPGNCAVAA